MLHSFFVSEGPIEPLLASSHQFRALYLLPEVDLLKDSLQFIKAVLLPDIILWDVLHHKLPVITGVLCKDSDNPKHHRFAKVVLGYLHRVDEPLYPVLLGFKQHLRIEALFAEVLHQPSLKSSVWELWQSPLVHLDKYVIVAIETDLVGLVGEGLHDADCDFAVVQVKLGHILIVLSGNQSDSLLCRLHYIQYLVVAKNISEEAETLSWNYSFG